MENEEKSERRERRLDKVHMIAWFFKNGKIEIIKKGTEKLGNHQNKKFW